MPKIGTEHPTNPSKMDSTLWFCHQCGAFISIYSAEAITAAICPICVDVIMDSRGSFEGILEIALRPNQSSTRTSCTIHLIH
jgi:hypothetical protein